jgi:LysM repeat protein
MTALCAGAAFAQGTSVDQLRLELANMREDMRLLSQRAGELALEVEQLKRDNGHLQQKANQSYVTVAQLNEAVAEMNKALRSALADQKKDMLEQVGTRIERLAKQTQAGLDALAKNQATRPAVNTAGFSDTYPKDGISYTVQSGDTLDVIARKTGAKKSDIINANKISDPSRLRAGQTLFIPGGK